MSKKVIINGVELATPESVQEAINAALPAWLPSIAGTADGISGIRGQRGVYISTAGTLALSSSGQINLTASSQLNLASASSVTIAATAQLNLNANAGIYTNTDIHIPEEEQVDLLALAAELEQ